MKRILFNTENNAENIAELDLYFSMNEAQLLRFYEPDLGLFVVESPMVIERALLAGYEPRSFIMLDTVADEMIQRFEELITKVQTDSGASKPFPINDIPVYISDYETIAGLTGVNITRGVLALMKRRELPSLEEVVRGCTRVAVLDDVENPTNVGALFRSAVALGIEAVILTGSSSDPLYRRASRVSVGNVFMTKWTKLSRKNRGKTDYVHELQNLGFKTAAMALSDKTIDISDSRLKDEERLAIILGNEGVGLSDEVISESDYVVKIPMAEGVDSLNVAAASAVAFWEITKKRKC